MVYKSYLLQSKSIDIFNFERKKALSYRCRRRQECPERESSDIVLNQVTNLLKYCMNQRQAVHGWLTSNDSSYQFCGCSNVQSRCLNHLLSVYRIPRYQMHELSLILYRWVGSLGSEDLIFDIKQYE